MSQLDEQKTRIFQEKINTVENEPSPINLTKKKSSGVRFTTEFVPLSAFVPELVCDGRFKIK